MFGFFKQKADPAAQIDDYLKKLAAEKFSDPAFKAAVKAELESFSQAKEVSNLEIALLGIHVGGATLPQLASALEHAEVMILTRSHEKPNECLHVLDPRDQTQRIAMFTSDKRATRAIQKHPDFRCLMAYPARVLILNIVDGAGIVVNPFEPVVTCNFNPKQLAALKGDIAKRPPPVPPPVGVGAANLPPLPTTTSASANNLEGLINQFRAGTLDPQSFFPAFPFS